MPEIIRCQIGKIINKNRRNIVTAPSRVAQELFSTLLDNQAQEREVNLRLIVEVRFTKLK